MIVRVANKYDAKVKVEKEDEQVNAKSIMGLMMLAAGQNSRLRFTATGVEATLVLQEIEKLFNRKFEEE
jgi:phosphocarrier protein